MFRTVKAAAASGLENQASPGTCAPSDIPTAAYGRFDNLAARYRKGQRADVKADRLAATARLTVAMTLAEALDGLNAVSTAPSAALAPKSWSKFVMTGEEASFSVRLITARAALAGPQR